MTPLEFPSNIRGKFEWYLANICQMLLNTVYGLVDCLSEIYRSQIIPCQTAPMVRQSECHICPMIDEHFEQASSDIEVNYIK